VIAKPKSACGQALFFIVQGGELKVTNKDNGAKTHLKAGNYFGEKVPSPTSADKSRNAPAVVVLTTGRRY
jgi:hypothetical protein